MAREVDFRSRGKGQGGGYAYALALLLTRCGTGPRFEHDDLERDNMHEGSLYLLHTQSQLPPFQAGTSSVLDGSAAYLSSRVDWAVAVLHTCANKD